MARTVIPVQDLPYQGGLTDIAYTAGDATNDHEFDNSSGRVMLVIKNGGASVCNVVVNSVADPYGREGDDTFAVAAGKDAIRGPYIPAIWNSGNKIAVDIDYDTSVEIGAFRFTLRK